MMRIKEGKQLVKSFHRVPPYSIPYSIEGNRMVLQLSDN